MDYNNIRNLISASCPLLNFARQKLPNTFAVLKKTIVFCNDRMNFGAGTDTLLAVLS
jgi:hypothetical protein